MQWIDFIDVLQKTEMLNELFHKMIPIGIITSSISELLEIFMQQQELIWKKKVKKIGIFIQLLSYSFVCDFSAGCLSADAAAPIYAGTILKKRRRVMKKDDGFTILEMMIVLSVIALIFLLTLPNIQQKEDIIRNKGCEA